MQKSMDEMLAEFAARGGKVQHVAVGEGNALTTRDWGKIVRSPSRVCLRPATDDDLAYRRHEAAQQAGFTGDHQFAAEVAAGLHDNALRRG